jgi:GNAT superfamily N-acetyltransferase
MNFRVRRIETRDEPRWRDLWDGYTRFYEREPTEAITQHLWSRIFDSSCPVYAIVVESSNGEIIGIANYLVHENTSRLAPSCYLQDLFVDPLQRGTGAGRMLIDWLIAEMKAKGWSRLYWNTREDNHRARRLYDHYTPHSGFVRYVVENQNV